MIVPEDRLLWLAALTAVPAALVWALAPALLPPVAALCGVAAALAAADLLLGWGRARALVVEGGETLLRLRRGGEGLLPLKLSFAGRGRPWVRLGLALPEGVTTSRREWQGTLARAERTRLDWPLRGAERGHFALGPLHARVTSPFGLWARQVVRPLAAEVAVYPNLAGERKALAAYFLHRGGAGLHVQRQVGQGREFEKLRDWLPGDPLADVHWKATARRGRLISKEFQLERTQRVLLCVDVSRLSARVGEEGNEPLLERFIGASLTLALAAERQGDLVGLATFSDQVHALIRPGKGTAHFGTLRDALYRLRPAPVSPDFRELAASLGLHLRRRALILVLTSLDDPALAEEFLAQMAPLARRHLVVVAMPRPEPARPLFSGPPAAGEEELYRHLGGHLVWQGLRELERRLRQQGVGFALIEREHLAALLITRYLEIKRRQLL